MLNNFKLIFSHSHLIPFYLILFILLYYFTRYAVRKISSIEKSQRRLLLIFRTATWGFILFSLINPLIHLQHWHTEKPKIGVLFDSSLSMMIKDKKGISRLSKAKEIIKQNKFTKLNKNFNIQYFHFNQEIHPTDQNTLLSIQGDGDLSDIGKALLRISSRGSHKGINNIILLSDGINNVYHDMIKIADLLKKKETKLFAFNLNQNEDIKDISIIDITHPTEVNIKTTVSLKVKINSIFYHNRLINIKILINDKLIQTKSIKIKKGLNILRIPITFHKIGVNKITIKCDPFPKESITLNNTRSVFIRSIKSKFKVLLVYGQPSFEYKFLKLALNQDPNIIADTYLKLKNNLKRIKSLNKYDLIIIGNIKYQDLPGSLVNQILAYANNRNGSLLFLGGQYGFRNGDYHVSKLKNIFPIHWQKSGEYYKSSYNVKLTPSGLNSPPMQLVNSMNSLQQYWDNLPPCNIINVIKKVKKGTDVLAVHNKDQELVILAIGKYKRVKVGIFTAYPTWKWGFLNIGMGYSENPFNIFWQQFIRYLINMNVNKIQLATNKLIYKKNEDISITLSLFNQKFAPIKKNKVSISLLKKDKEQYNRIKTFELYPSSTDGLYDSLINIKEHGEYKLKLNLSPYKAETLFLIRKPTEELYHLKGNNKLIKDLTQITDGKVLTKEQINEVNDLMIKKETKQKIQREFDLWPNWILLLAILSLLSGEWYLRKKNNLA